MSGFFDWFCLVLLRYALLSFSLLCVALLYFVSLALLRFDLLRFALKGVVLMLVGTGTRGTCYCCFLYTSDAADEDGGGDRVARRLSMK